jgi:hypothetical protein
MRVEGWNGAIGNVQWWARALTFSVMIGAIIALLGPYGSYYNDLSLRLIDWIVVLLLDTIVLGVAVPPVVRISTAAGLPRAFSFGIAILIGAIPAAAVSAAVSKFFWGPHVTEYRWHDWYLQTLLLTVIVVLLWAVAEIVRVSHANSAAAPAVETARESSGNVICLQMEDHYVRIHRDGGSVLELMPLREAIRRYGRPDGLQVHRSWWVASGAVASAGRDVRSWRLTLRNGLIVPVARNRIGDARRRGWLD